MPVEQLAEVGLAQPAVDARADLDAHGLGNDRRVSEPPCQVDLAESAFADQPFGAILKVGLRTFDDLARHQGGPDAPPRTWIERSLVRVVASRRMSRHERKLSDSGCLNASPAVQR